MVQLWISEARYIAVILLYISHKPVSNEIVWRVHTTRDLINIAVNTCLISIIYTDMVSSNVFCFQASKCIVYLLFSIIQDGRTAVMKASYEDHTDVVKVLAEAKANLNLTNQVNLMINYLLHSQ